ncbi:MAG: hypothetical protein DRO88_02590 [Promethearchaeia archaeon]|nr:MAG: hypothetical protein DRO88_02590 [Candidatus Lokiarchaeia archaeon]
MEQVYIGEHKHTAVLKPFEINSLSDFYEKFVKDPLKGSKGGFYFTTASEVELTPASKENTKDGRDKDHYRRNLKTHVSSWCVCIDGDQSVDNPDSCIDPILIHQSLKAQNINHIIYTTSSYNPPQVFKWRLIVPCELKKGSFLKQRHVATVSKLYDLINCKDLKQSNESFTLPQMWFLPAVPDPGVSEYQSFYHFSGEDLTPMGPGSKQNLPTGTTSYCPESEIVNNIVHGISPLHASINKYIYGNIQDGRKPEAIKATLHGLTSGWNMNDDKLKKYKEDLNRLVDAAASKFKHPENDDHWQVEEEKRTDKRVYTRYPDQGGLFEELVKCCMDWMIFPNRQIAVTAARTVISTLGARSYTLPTGKGIALTALITGRSTIGKSNIKKFFIWVLDNFVLGSRSQEFLGAQYYTSVKNMVEDLTEKYSLLSVRTESGQSDKSKAGDMSRVMAYELEFSTESGESGYISSGAQNDKIPALYSPGVTTIRESVAEIQSDADVMNQTTVAGVAGRRSHVIIDPIKAPMNTNRIDKVPTKIRKLINQLYKIASDPNKKDCTRPLEPKHWIYIQYADEKFFKSRWQYWLDQENKAALNRDDYESTFYGRLYERVPAYAGILAVCDNPEKPLITNDHLKIAEKSLFAEFNAHRKQEETGVFDSELDKLIKKIEEIFIGDMTPLIKHYKKSLWGVGEKELKDGAMEWVPLRRKINRRLRKLSERELNEFNRNKYSLLRDVNIHQLGKDETLELYGHARLTFKRL